MLLEQNYTSEAFKKAFYHLRKETFFFGVNNLGVEGIGMSLQVRLTYHSPLQMSLNIRNI